MNDLKNTIIKVYILIASIFVMLLFFCTNAYASEMVVASSDVLPTTNYYHNTDRILNKDELGDYNSSSDYYDFTPGASLLQNDINTLVFEITLKDETLKDNNDFICYFFTLLNADATGSSIDYGIELILTIDSEKNGVIALARKNVNYKEEISLYGYDYNDNELDTTTRAYDVYESYKSIYEDDNYIIENECSFNNESSYIKYCGENELKLYIQVKTTSVYNYYSILYYYVGSFMNVMPIVSSLVSVHDVLTQMNMFSKFENELDLSMVEQAYYIVNDSSKRDVIVEYLVRIEDTPFAIKKQSKINVPVLDGKVKSSDVAIALGLKNMGVMQSYCGDFIYNTEKGIYETTYQKSIWLSAKSVDGNSANYFLDCNLSYYDYYHQFVEDEIFSNDLYEYIFNKMQLDYPQISSYKPNEIYGYFGFVSIPNTYSINALWEEMFGSNKTFSGVLYKYCYTENLKLSSYNKLLEEYQYNWLEIAWNDCGGLFSGGSWSADNYLFYADVETNEAFIAENGADDIYDDDGLVKNDVEDFFESANFEKIILILGIFALISVLNFITPIFKFIGIGLLAIFKAIWYVLTLPFKFIAKLFKRKKY